MKFVNILLSTNILINVLTLIKIGEEEMFFPLKRIDSIFIRYHLLCIKMNYSTPFSKI